MICPRCSVAEISAETNRCVLCGYSPGTGAVGVGVEVRPWEELDQHARRELEGLFRLESVVRRGPDALIYVAREVETERRVTLKAVPRQPVREAGLEDRFSRDAATAASLDHPHIVPIFRFGATAHLLWYSMKHVEGRSLAELLAESGPMDLHACLRIVEQVASALQYAHRRGVVHGSVQPAHVLVDAQEWALVTDFAVGRLLERVPSATPPGEDAPVRRTEYAAPEEAYARQPGPGADQFALAVLVYECLAGVAPERPPKPLVALRPEIPVPLADALQRALSVQPTARFMNVLEFVSVLGTGDPGSAMPAAPRSSPRPSANQRVLFVDQPSQSRRWVGIGIGLAIAFAALVGGYQILSTSGGSAPPAGIDGPVSSGIQQPPIQTPVPPPAPAPSAQPDVRPAPPAQTQAQTSGSRPTTPTRPAVRPAAPAQPRQNLQPGRLFVNATPWGQLYIDDELIGNTPQAELEVSAGTHRVRVIRSGFRPFELELQLAPGQEVRLTDIILEPIRP